MDLPSLPSVASAKRRPAMKMWRLRFGIRHLLLAMAVVGVLAAFVSACLHETWRQERLYRQVSSCGATVYVTDFGVAVSFGPTVPPLPSGQKIRRIDATPQHRAEFRNALRAMLEIKNLTYVDLGGDVCRDERRMAEFLKLRCRDVGGDIGSK